MRQHDLRLRAGGVAQRSCLVSLELRHTARGATHCALGVIQTGAGVDDDMKTEVRFSFAGSKPGQLSATFASW